MRLSLKSPRPIKPEKRSTSRRPRPRSDKASRSVTVYISLGSNLGRRHGYLEKARNLLPVMGADIIARSFLYLTSPQGFRLQPSFLNQVLAAETRLTPLELLDVFHRIERRLGRIRLFANAPRTIDIDLLFYHNLVMDTPSLTIPHPRLHQRGFILLPLNEIAPGFRHPLTGKTVGRMLAEADVTGVRRW